MYVKRIELLNFQTIKEFSGEFEGSVYFVTGENEFGKSTLLKAIAVLLTGSRDEVLNNQSEKGFAKTTICDDAGVERYEVELRFTKANPRGTLTITDLVSGMKSDKVTLLQSIFGYQEFDANEFSQWSETAEGRRKQVAIVKSLLPVDVQERIAVIDKEIITVQENRKVDNVNFKSYDNLLKAKETAVTPDEYEKYAEPKDLTELINRKTATATLTEQIKSVTQRMEQRTKELEETPSVLADEKTDYDLEVENLSKEEKELREEFDRKLKAIEAKRTTAKESYETSVKEIEAKKLDNETKNKSAKAWLDANPAEKLEDIQKEIDELEDHNKIHRKVVAYKENQAKSKAVEKEIAAKNTKIKTLETERETLIKKSKLPITGLNFTEDGLTLNGVPFAPGQVSSSQEMEVAAKLIIAKNPKIKVFRVARGESLGHKKLNALIDFARQSGYQGFIEQVVRDQNELRVEEYSEVNL